MYIHTPGAMVRTTVAAAPVGHPVVAPAHVVEMVKLPCTEPWFVTEYNKTFGEYDGTVYGAVRCTNGV
jgi:hypothetical protein